jgi:hydroxymethylpyrimidine/phosphomethylpyrimidine kinase
VCPIALTIAGSDPSGGAGMQADLKTFHRFGVYGEAVITLLTVQNTEAVSRVEVLDAELVLEQLEAVLSDIPPQAAKTGALGSSSIVRALAQRARSFDFPLVVDPVMVSKHGRLLVENDAIELIRGELLPRAFLITPNLAEAAALTGLEVTTVDEMRDAARALCELGAKAALVKGGHLKCPADECSAVDVLFVDGIIHEFASDRVPTRHTHGTGCTYSAAITAGLALGHDLITAVANAKAFIIKAIATNPGLGRGSGPLNHWA